MPRAAFAATRDGAPHRPRYMHPDSTGVAPVCSEQAATLLEDSASGLVRELSYDDDGQLVLDNASNGYRTFSWNPAGCLTDVEAYTWSPSAGLGAPTSTRLVCDASGNTAARQTLAGGVVTRSSIDIGGLGEVRPEEGVFLLRLPVNRTVLIEEARSLATGARIAARTGYTLSDARGSVLARTSFNGATVAEEAEYDVWGATLDLGAGLGARPGDGALSLRGAGV